MMYPDLPFLERFEAAANDGFTAVEFLFPYAYKANELAARVKGNGLKQVLFNMPPGGTDTDSIAAAWNSGLRGTTCHEHSESQLTAAAQLALRYAEILDCPRVHLMAGLLPNGQTRDQVKATYVANVQLVCRELKDLTVLIEPINTRDIPGFFLNRQDQAHELIEKIGASNAKVQMDLYHCQIVEGDVAMKLRQYLPTGNVGHMQIAGVPLRHEPDIGELHYPYLFEVIDSLGYAGWIGCEYRPLNGQQKGATSAQLGWLKPYLPGGG